MTAASTTAAAALTPPPRLLCRIQASFSPSVVHITSYGPRRRRSVTCQAAVTTEVSSSPSSSSSPSDAIEEPEEVSRVGARIRVTAHVKVYHVVKAPELDLYGMEGTIKQYVGFWKGKHISANLPFKVEFVFPVEGQPQPVKLLAHLKEEEFEYVD